MTTTKTALAVLDDEAKLRSAIARLLKANGCEVELFASGEAFLESVEHHVPDCLLLDLHMPGMTGFDVLESLAARHLHLPVVVITGHDEPGNSERVRSLGAAAYLLKPVNRTTLMATIADACRDPAHDHPTLDHPPA